MKWISILIVAAFCFAALAAPVSADGTLQWGTCPAGPAVITDANTGGALVPVGGLVELWDENGAGRIATAHIGEGYITPQAGRFIRNTSVPDGNYRLQIRVYNIADPYATGVVSCVVFVGENGSGTPGIDTPISTLLPATICYPSAEIPTGNFTAPDGGCQVLAPLAVTLESFDAVEIPEGVLVRWETVNEIGNSGFNLHRGLAAGGPWTQLNSALIPSQAPGSNQGFSYEFRDDNVVEGTTYFYLLETIDVRGASTQHGPISILYIGVPTAVSLTSLQAQATSPSGGLAVAVLAMVSLLLVGYRRRNKPSAPLDSRSLR